MASRQERQIVQSCKTLYDSLPGFTPSWRHLISVRSVVRIYPGPIASRVSRLPSESIRWLPGALADFGLNEARLDSKWRIRAVSLSVTYGVAFYDAAYHAVALGLGGVFVTADERYVRRASRAGRHIVLAALANAVAGTAGEDARQPAGTTIRSRGPR